MSESNPAAPWRAVLQTAADVRASFQTFLTPEERAALPPEATDRELVLLPQTALSPAQVAQAETQFELVTAVTALETLALEIEVVLARRMEELYAEALQIYYASEALSRDPAHAELLPFVEAMRSAHEREYGRPIPPRRDH
jgi:hypothetical protein